ncbi:MAG: hypothetical protein HY265_03630 [Deltaproteobacteria bacterium]|nr:hypothetical protein [Deltaproteobacteria bacterium]
MKSLSWRTKMFSKKVLRIGLMAVALSKNLNLLILAVLTLVITVGCATLFGSKISEPEIASLPNNSFQISLSGEGMVTNEALQAEWYKAAAQKCADYEIITHDFTRRSSLTISGVIKCKK